MLVDLKVTDVLNKVAGSDPVPVSYTHLCRTVLHVHVKQRYTPRHHTLLYEMGLY